MKYFLRKTKNALFDTDSKSGEITEVKCQEIEETEIESKNIDDQVIDDKFDKTQIHICRHDEGLPCELVDVVKVLDEKEIDIETLPAK